MAIAVFSAKSGDVRYSTSQQSALTISRVTRMILLEGTGCVFGGFELVSVMALVKGSEEGQHQQVPSGACGHANTSDRAWEEWGSCPNFCISLQCSCVQGTLQTPHHAETGNTSLHASRGHIRAKLHREVNSTSQHEWEMQPEKSLPQKSLAPTHTTDISTGLGIHCPCEIHQSCSPGCLWSLWQPTRPSFTCVGVTQNPKLLSDAESCQTTAGGVFIF